MQQHLSNKPDPCIVNWQKRPDENVVYQSQFSGVCIDKDTNTAVVGVDKEYKKIARSLTQKTQQANENNQRGTKYDVLQYHTKYECKQLDGNTTDL